MSFNNDKKLIPSVKLSGKIMTKEEFAGFLFDLADNDTFIEIRGTKETIDKRTAVDFLLKNKTTSNMIDFVKSDIILDIIVEKPLLSLEKDLGYLINLLNFDCFFVPENNCYIRITKKGIPYVFCQGWNYDSTQAYFILYPDETGIRGYVPIYGNVINRYTKLSFVNEDIKNEDLLFFLEEKLINKKEYDKALKDENYLYELSEELLEKIYDENPDYDKMIEEIETVFS